MAYPMYREQDDGSWRDDHGRLAGSDAVFHLMASIPPGPAWNHHRPANTWDAATDAADRAAEVDVRAAAAHLLALHMFDLWETEPQVATRNVQSGDLLRISGIPYRVVEKIDVGRFRARPEHNPDRDPELFGGGQMDAHYPLIERPAAAGDGDVREYATSAPDITTHNTPGAAYLQIGDIRLTFKTGDSDARQAALAALDQLGRAVAQIKRSLAATTDDGDAR